ncbi:methyltransferase type 11 [Paenibacillus helianthi]|uniref:Methyltransferase type 11 n=1 Tax=Paenibacillus helianthi TaxID=1349432 RepID=A0ABX3EPR5_9BACL|nr:MULTISPECIES: class I SAM-dependent methyltransferase [Paenibacillus]OKP77928.1 methyltransferase type 11 [Paenibacillus sp. P3E]OKP87711.1 methyltransferase type 11 [Paenibacillus helianthi]OKP93374.1 methyltransferase type 11 [Paenibacillus sp. P32E]
MPTHPYVSRFFVNADARRDKLVYDLPESWWSRPYEYEWCTNFVSPHDVVLDAACGISHPLKFYLASYSAEVHACDMDARILSRDAIMEEISGDIGEEAALLAGAARTNRLHLAQANLTSLPYENEFFDTIFCISVLEHLSLEDSVRAVREFHRTLNEEGLLVLTFDYPTVNLLRINEVLLQAGFEYWGETDFKLPADAVRTEQWGGLSCFRAVLKKARL